MEFQQRARAAVFEASGRELALQQWELAPIAGEETLIEIEACSICGSDLHTLEGRRDAPLPLVLGHEILGRIVARGDAAPTTDYHGRPLALGQRVTWSIAASCGGCFFCRRQLPQKCERQVKYGHVALTGPQGLRGGMATHCRLAPGTAVFAIPDELAAEIACPANCATATVAAMLEASGPLRDTTVLVLGAGMLGITAVCWLKQLQVGSVIVCERDPARRQLASEFGADRTVGPAELVPLVHQETDGYGVDVVLELTGVPEALETALPAARVGATLVLAGAVYPSRPLTLGMETIVRRCWTLRGVHNYRPEHLAQALEFLADCQRSARPVPRVERWFALDEVNQAIRTAPHHLRVGIKPGLGRLRPE